MALKVTAILEDVTIEAERDLAPHDGKWTVWLSETPNDISSDPIKKAQLILDDEGFGLMLYLAAGGSDEGEIAEEAYGILEPLLEDLPIEIRPIP